MAEFKEQRGILGTGIALCDAARTLLHYISV